MRGKRVPPKEPVDGILQSTKTRYTVSRKDDATVLLFRCARCRHMLAELIRLDESDACSVWIGGGMEGPWWSWDGNILRPTTTHLEERQRLHEHARSTT